MASSSPQEASYVISGEPLGAGQFSKVYLGRKRLTSEKLAVKIMDLKALFKRYPQYKKYLDRELQTMRLLQPHQHIVHLEDIRETPDQVFIAMEYCSGGTLQDYLKLKRVLPELQAQDFLRQIGSGIQQMHGKSVAHRDLKPQNILISDMDNPVLKIADFGFARLMEEGQQLNASLVGSPLYMAPEIQQGIHYADTCDLWSVGIIFLEMLCGFTYVVQNVVSIRVHGLNVASLPNPNLSADCKDLLRQLLIPDQNIRIKWIDFFSHPFLREPHPELSLLMDPGVKSLQAFMFPSLTTDNLVLPQNDMSVADWKKENNWEKSIVVFCHDCNKNKYIEHHAKWEGIELKDSELLSYYNLQMGDNRCLFVFSEDISDYLTSSHFIAEADAEVNFDVPDTSVDVTTFMHECARVGEQLFKSTAQLFAKCSKYILTRELLQLGYRALVVINRNKKYNTNEKCLKLKENITDPAARLVNIDKQFIKAASSLEQIIAVATLPTSLAPKPGATLALAEKYKGKLEATQVSNIGESLDTLISDINNIYWKVPPFSLGDPEKFSKMKNDLNGEIYECRRNVEIFKNILGDHCEKIQNTKLSDRESEEKKMRGKSLIDYSKILNRKVRDFLTKCQETIAEEQDVFNEVQKTIEQYQTLGKLAGERANDLKVKSLRELTIEAQHLIPAMDDLEQFIMLYCTVERSIGELYERQCYEKQLVRIQARLNDFFHKLYEGHLGKLEHTFSSNGLMQELFPGFAALSALPRLIAKEDPPATLHNIAEIARYPLLKMPSPTLRRDDFEDEFELVHKEVANVNELIKNNAELNQRVRSLETQARQRRDREPGEKEILRQAAQYDHSAKVQDAAAKDKELVDIRAELELMRKQLQEKEDEMKKKESAIRSATEDIQKKEDTLKAKEVELRTEKASRQEQVTKSEEQILKLKDELNRRSPSPSPSPGPSTREKEADKRAAELQHLLAAAEKREAELQQKCQQLTEQDQAKSDQIAIQNDTIMAYKLSYEYSRQLDSDVHVIPPAAPQAPPNH